MEMKSLLYLEINKPNKQNVYEINLFQKFTFNTLIDVRTETSKHHFLKSVKINAQS